jgi:AcrR family transcriptional regulator
MARILKLDKHNLKRNEIIDSAIKFIYSLGYELMSIQNIIDELQISKGAFYHYFNSKQDLLEAVIERMMVEILAVINPIANDPTLSAIEKLDGYFKVASIWKLEHANYLTPIFKVWYTDENTIVRDKSYHNVMIEIAPVLESIIEQGMREGVFKISSSYMMGHVVYELVFGMGDIMAKQLISSNFSDFDSERFYGTIEVFTTSLERILGAEPGSIQIIDEKVLRGWVENYVVQENGDPVKLPR